MRRLTSPTSEPVHVPKVFGAFCRVFGASSPRLLPWNERFQTGPEKERIPQRRWDAERKYPLPPLRLRASAAEFFTYLVRPFGLKSRNRREEVHFFNFRTGPRSQSIWSLLQSI